MSCFFKSEIVPLILDSLDPRQLNLAMCKYRPKAFLHRRKILRAQILSLRGDYPASINYTMSQKLQYQQILWQMDSIMIPGLGLSYPLDVSQLLLLDLYCLQSLLQPILLTLCLRAHHRGFQGAASDYILS